MEPLTRWTAVFALGVIAGSGVYFYHRPAADNLDQVVSPAQAKPGSTESPPPAIAYPMASSVGRINPISANAVSVSSSSPPTTGPQQTFGRLRDRLHDQAFRRTHTYREFLAVSMPEWESLPEDMKKQLMTEMNSMIERGEFGPEQFVPEPGAPLATTPTPDASPPPTAEQQRTYENIRSKLHDPGFTQTKTLSQLAALPELQTLPAALRQQLEREALEMLDRGELLLRQEVQASSGH